MKRILYNRLLSNPYFYFLLLIFVSYYPVLNGVFFFDDEHFILRNIAVLSFDLPSIFGGSVTESAFIGGDFYRPLQQFFYALANKLFGLKPFPFHLLSVLFHFGVASILFRIFLHLGFNRFAAFIAVLFYALHPAHTEAVAYISGLADPLGFFLGLMAVTTSISAIKRKTSSLFLLFITCLFYILALLSKENMIVILPLIILLSLFFYFREDAVNTKALLVINICIFSISIIYTALRFSVFDFGEGFGLTQESNVYTENLHVRLITFVNIIVEYFRIIVFPLDLNYEKDYMAFVSLLYVRAIPGMMLFVLTAFFTIKIRKYPYIFLGLSWFLAALIPYSGIIPLNAMFLEHWLYIPLAGISLLWGRLIDFFIRKKRMFLLYSFSIIPLVLFIIKDMDRSAEWGTPEEFYLNELEYTGSSVRICNNLGMIYAEEKKWDKAEYYYKEALQSMKNYPQPYHNLANMYLSRGDTLMAVDYLKEALVFDPCFIYSQTMLYGIYIRQSKLDEAAEILLQMQDCKSARK